MEKFIDRFDVYGQVWISKDNTFIVGCSNSGRVMMPVETITSFFINELKYENEYSIFILECKQGNDNEDFCIESEDFITGWDKSLMDTEPTKQHRLEYERLAQRLYEMFEASRKRQNHRNDIAELKARLDRVDDLLAILAHYVNPLQK